MTGADSKFDVAIIGAGPAGSTAAIALARAGRSVILIEKKNFPRPKVCGGCLSGPAVARLKALWGDHCTMPGVRGSRITFVIGPCRVTCNPRGVTRMVSRSTLDACLAETASLSGATIRHGEPARMERGPAGWEVYVGRDHIQAGTVLVASGLGQLAHGIGIRGRKCATPMIAQQWVQAPDSPLQQLGCVELHWLRGGYVGLATPEKDQCVVAMAARSTMISGRSAFDGLRRLNPGASVWSLLPSDAPRRYGAKGTAGFPWLPERLGDANVLLIGDAAGYSEPFSGAGIAQAMHSADCAARAIVEGGNILQKYAALMRPHRRLLWRTRMISSVLDVTFRHSPSSKLFLFAERWLSRWVDRIHIRGEL